MSRQTKNDIAELKDKYVEYYKEVPIQRYAAMFIGRTEQTIIDWCKNDNTFFNRVQEAKALWIKKLVYKSKAEFALERLEYEVFGRQDKLAITSNTPNIALVQFIGEDN